MKARCGLSRSASPAFRGMSALQRVNKLTLKLSVACLRGKLYPNRDVEVMGWQPRNKAVRSVGKNGLSLAPTDTTKKHQSLL
jgi:hypothetical protein